MNKICLVGRIAHNLELKTTNCGKYVCEFDLAVKRAFERNEVDFLRCVVWNTAAENLVKYQSKGGLIAVEGALQLEKYRDKEGKNKNKYYIIVGNIEYLAASKENEKVNNMEIGDDLPF